MASMVASPLKDGHGRLIGDLRVSVTDRCNFRCQYCMPAEGLPWLERPELLTFEEIERVVRLLVPLGVRSVRLTGGEPLVRRELPKLIAMLSAIEGLDDLSLTTNGYLLAKLADELVDAGLERINVSLDSLSRDRFFQITRRDSLPQVIEGLETLERFPQLGPVKVNCVAMRGFTEDEVLPFAELARRKPYQVRFIEFMPLDADHAWSEDRVLTGAEIRAMIDRVHPLEPLPRERHATAKVWRFRDGVRRDRVRQPGLRAFLRGLRPHPPDGRGQAANLPLQLERDRPPRASSGRLRRRRARGGHPRRGLAQGAQAPRVRARVPPAAAHDEPDRRIAVTEPEQDRTPQEHDLKPRGGGPPERDLPRTDEQRPWLRCYRCWSQNLEAQVHYDAILQDRSRVRRLLGARRRGPGGGRPVPATACTTSRT